MKRIFWAIMAVCTQLACAEVSDLQCQVEDAENGKVRLSVSLPVIETRATGASDEDKISNVQVLVFSSDTDLIEAYLSADSPDISKPLELTCTTGSKKIIVMVNSNVSYEKVLNSSDASLKSAELRYNTKDKHFMYGVKEVNLMSSQTVTVEVSRQIAKVVLKKVEVDFESEALAEADLIMKAVYMINVCNQIKIPYDASTFDSSYYSNANLWYNKMRYQSDSYDAYLYDKVSDVPLNSDASYTTGHYFYVFPNTAADSNASLWSPRYTRMVVETTYMNNTYYYPVNIPNIKSNTVYTVSMKITRLGSSSPDIPVTTTSGGIEIDIKEWEYAKEINEVI